MSVDSNICHDLLEFIDCYTEEGKPEKPCAEASIVRKFSHLNQYLAQKLVIKDVINLMC